MCNKINRDTIGDISRRAALKYPDKKALIFREKQAQIFREKQLTYRELELNACRFANLMIRLGVKKGDRVAINAYNSHHYPISLLGLAKIGAVQVPINYMLNAAEIDYSRVRICLGRSGTFI